MSSKSSSNKSSSDKSSTLSNSSLDDSTILSESLSSQSSTIFNSSLDEPSISSTSLLNESSTKSKSLSTSSFSSNVTVRQRSNTNVLAHQEVIGSVITLIDRMNCPQDIKHQMQEHMKSIQIVVKKSDDIPESMEASGTRTNNNCQNRIVTCTWSVITFVCGGLLLSGLSYLLIWLLKKIFKWSSNSNLNTP